MGRFTVYALLIASLTLALSMRAEEPKKPLVPTIKQIMREAHECRTAYIRDVRNEMVKEEPNWELIAGRSRELVRAGKLLSLNTPPKGSAESWEKLTSLYIARATILVDAAERKDKDEGHVVARRLQTMCAGCHRVHK
jgi:hypothetical protein